MARFEKWKMSNGKWKMVNEEVIRKN